jgi:hypothetical protein
MSILERVLVRMLGGDYRTLAERQNEVEARLRTIETTTRRIDKKVYRDEGGEPAVKTLQAKLEAEISGSLEQFPMLAGDNPLNNYWSEE